MKDKSMIRFFAWSMFTTMALVLAYWSIARAKRWARFERRLGYLPPLYDVDGVQTLLNSLDCTAIAKIVDPSA